MNFNINNIIRPSIAKLKAYSSARDEFNSSNGNEIFIDANENPFNNGLNRYPDPHQQVLKQKLAQIKNIPASSILLGNGSDEILDLLFRAFCEPAKDAIVIASPTYGMYQVLAAINNIEVVAVSLNNNFELDAAQILAAVTKNTKIICLCSPNNPSGNSFSESVITQILLNFNGLVIIDEAYIDFSNQDSWLNKLQEFPNLVITQTMSKAWGLAGIRLGFCFAAPQIIEVLKKIKPPYNINQLTQKVALEQLENETETLKQIEIIKANKQWLSNELATLPIVKKVYPSDANFLLVQFEDAQKINNYLRGLGIIVRNRSSLEGCEGCLRITVGTTQENKTLITALKTA